MIFEKHFIRKGGCKCETQNYATAAIPTNTISVHLFYFIHQIGDILPLFLV